MPELTDYSDEGIRLWVAEQQRYADGIKKSDPRYRDAMLIRHYIDGIRVLLQRPTPSVEPRRHQLLTELISKWRGDNPSLAPPYYALNAQATNQAWHEARGDIIDLAEAILKLRANP